MPAEAVCLIDSWEYAPRYTYSGPPSDYPLARMLAERSASYAEPSRSAERPASVIR